MAQSNGAQTHANIFYAFNNHYAPFCGVSLTSLFINNKDIDKITVYLFMENVSDENKQKFLKLGQEFGREIVFVDGAPIIERVKAAKLEPYQRNSVYTTYLKIFFDDAVRPDVKRLIYIDCDTLVVGSIKPLIDYDLGGCCAGIARDPISLQKHKLMGYQELYNTGMIVYDVVRWRNEHWLDKIFDHVKNVRTIYPYCEQSLLNVVAAEHICSMPLKYNYGVIHRMISDKGFKKIVPKSFRETFPWDFLKEARENPVILHTFMVLGQLPWNRDSIHPDRELFDQYCAMSLWSDYKRVESSQKAIYKIERFLYKHLPRPTFFRLFYFLKKYHLKTEEKMLVAKEQQQKNKM